MTTQDRGVPLLPSEQFYPQIGLGRNTFYRLLHEGRIRHIRIGRKVYVLASELMDFPEREARLHS